MNTIPVHTRFSRARPVAVTALGVLGVMSLPAWAGDPTVQQLQAQVAALQQTVATLQKSVIPLLSVVSFDPAHNLVQFRGVNVQIVNGLGTTPTTNGAGNLIIGYNEDDGNARGTCTVSGPVSSFEEFCTAAGGTFTRSLNGSHNLVVGLANGYSSYGGIVVGNENLISAAFANVSAGIDNTASGGFSSVLGGEGNTASGDSSTVSGGFGNTASSGHGSVSGGQSIVEGTASGWAAGGNNTPAFHSP